MQSPDTPPIFKIAMPVPLPGLFDYLAPQSGAQPLPGSRVVATFGRRNLVAVVVGIAARSDVPTERLQSISSVLDEGEPLVTHELLGLAQWCARYYKHPLGEVLINALPPALRKAGGTLPPAPAWFRLSDSGRERLSQPVGRIKAQWQLLQCLADGPLNAMQLKQVHSGAIRALKPVLEQGWVLKETASIATMRYTEGPSLNPEQQSAFGAIAGDLGRFSCHLVDGVTGSGKTEIYIRLAQEVLEQGQQVLILVPEIGLTPQLVRRFQERLGLVPILSHSAMSAGDRLRAYASARRGDGLLMIGTRSALFLPLMKPGLIIMDESHDASFKQQDGFRFSARDVAVKRALDLDVPIVLGTATPSLESLYNAQQGRYHRHVLSQRATGACQPAWKLTDLRQQATEAGLARPALEAIAEALQRQEQVLVFLNRRGYAPVLLCHDCGWHARCSSCDANMTWHRKGRQLVCHHCNSRQRVPRFCPDCKADALQGAGEGTEQLDNFLSQQFPDTVVLRVDRDRVRRRGELQAIMEKVKEGESCILVGTQMLAKGHHFPRVTLVVVVGLDQALYSADYRAMERMGQLLLQVAGRAGRDQLQGTVLLQTHHPDHPALETLLTGGYGPFALDLLQERRLAALPPFAFQAVLRAEATDRQLIQSFLQEAASLWSSQKAVVYGPFPAMMEKRLGKLRWYLLLQSSARPALQAALDDWMPQVRGLKSARKVRWAVDVDPQEF